MVQRSYRGLLWGLALLGLTLDQSSKYGVFRWLYNDGLGDEREVIPGVFKLLTQFTLTREPGDQWLSPFRTWSGEMLPKVKAMRPDVPVIMITAYGDPDTRRKVIEGGATGLLTKPIDFALLREEIDARLEKAS